MPKLSQIIWSFRLDFQLIFLVKGIPFREKISFLVKKYLILIRNIAVGSKSPRCTQVFGGKYYYNETFGLTSLQRVYCESYWLKEQLPEQPTIVDVGANNGQFRFFCNHYLGACRVVSVEPLASCHEILVLNSSTPSDCHNNLVGSQTGEAEFFRSRVSPQLSSIVKDTDGDYDPPTKLPMIPLDEIVARSGVGRIDLLKVDTEGSEYDVLISGEMTLQSVELILIEMSIFRASLGNMFMTGAFLGERGFKLVSLSGSLGRHPKDIDGLFRKQ